jgi:hypothetical protein
LTVFSQQDTDTLRVKCFPKETVKLIMADIVKGESAIKQLEITQKELKMVEKQSIKKDSMIILFREKEVGYNKMIDAEKEKYTIVKNFNEKLEKDLRKERTKNKFIITISTAAVGILTGLLITK